MAFKNCSTVEVLRKGFFYLTAIAFVVMCVPTTTTALPLTDLLAQSMQAAKEEGAAHDRVKRAVSTTPCAKPTNLEQMFQSINSLISTKFLRPAIGGMATNVTDSEKGSLIPGDPNESKTCPSTLTRIIDAPLAHRSLCPYYNDILVLPQGYYPQYLNYAKCKCQDCVENTAFGCEPVLTEVRLLRPTGCSNGMQLYEEKLVRVATSCTCAFKGKLVSGDLPYATTTTPAPSGGLPGEDQWGK